MPDDNEDGLLKDNETGRFLPGNIGGGRPKGSRNKLGEAFLSDIYADWKEHGVAAIKEVRETKPDAYLKVVASMLPQNLNINVNQTDSMTDDQLIERIRALDATIRPFLALEGEGRTDGGFGPETAH